MHLGAVGCGWMRLDAVGCGWMQLDAVGCGWMQLGGNRTHLGAPRCTHTGKSLGGGIDLGVPMIP